MDHSEQDGTSTRSKSSSTTTSKSSSKSSKSSKHSEKHSNATSDSRYLKHHARKTIEEYKYLLEMATQKLISQQKRTEDVEARARELATLLKQANESRVQAVREADSRLQRLNEYKTLYEAAQREIYHAQTVLHEVDAERVAARNEAAEARNKIRKMNQERKVQNAREEGRQVGLREGLEKARELGLHGGPLLPFELAPQVYHYPPQPYTTSSNERDSVDFVVEEPSTLRTTRFSRPAYTPPAPPAPQHPPRAPSQASDHLSDSPKLIPPPRSIFQPPPVAQPVAPPPNPPAPAPEKRRASEQTAERPNLDQIRPIIVHALPQHSPRFAPIIPPEGFIPEVGEDGMVRLPPPHELVPVPPTPDRPLSPLLPGDNQQPLMIPDPGSRFFRPTRAPSSPGSNSTTLSQLDIVNVVNEAGRDSSPPLSVIPEVLSSTTSPPTGVVDSQLIRGKPAQLSQQGAAANIVASQMAQPAPNFKDNQYRNARSLSRRSRMSTDYTPTESSMQSGSEYTTQQQAEPGRVGATHIAPPQAHYINPYEGTSGRYQAFNVGYAQPPSSSKALSRDPRHHSSQHNPTDYQNMSMTTSSGVAVIPDRTLFSNGSADQSLSSSETSTSGKRTQGHGRQSHLSGMPGTVEAGGAPGPTSVYAGSNYSGYPAANAPTRSRPASRNTNRSRG